MNFTLKVAEEVGVPEMIFCPMAASSFMANAQYHELMRRGITPLKGEITFDQMQLYFIFFYESSTFFIFKFFFFFNRIQLGRTELHVTQPSQPDLNPSESGPDSAFLTIL